MFYSFPIMQYETGCMFSSSLPFRRAPGAFIFRLPLSGMTEAECAVVVSIHTAASGETAVNGLVEAYGQCDASSPAPRGDVAEPSESHGASSGDENPDGDRCKRSGSHSTYLPGYTKSGKRRRRHPVAEVKGGWSLQEDARLEQ